MKNKENRAILKSKIESKEISTKIRPQQHAKHIEGTSQFNKYRADRIAKGKTPQSILTITEKEAQELVNLYSCTGAVEIEIRKDGTAKIVEYCSADRIIGKYYISNEYRETKRFGIFYSKRGTHIVPTRPEKE